MKKTSLQYLRHRLKKRDGNLLERLEVKPFVIPSELSKDDSTINHTKRVGGQVMQMYGLHVKDLDLVDNAKYYYLVSGLYPFEIGPDYSKTKATEIDIKVSGTKIHKESEDSLSSTSCSLVSIDLKKVIERHSYDLGMDSLSTNSVSFLDMHLEKVIERHTHSVGLDSLSSIDYKFIDMRLTPFPFLYKPVFESSKTSVTSITLKEK